MFYLSLIMCLIVFFLSIIHDNLSVWLSISLIVYPINYFHSENVINDVDSICPRLLWSSLWLGCYLVQLEKSMLRLFIWCFLKRSSLHYITSKPPQIITLCVYLSILVNWWIFPYFEFFYINLNSVKSAFYNNVKGDKATKQMMQMLRVLGPLARKACKYTKNILT